MIQIALARHAHASAFYGPRTVDELLEVLAELVIDLVLEYGVFSIIGGGALIAFVVLLVLLMLGVFDDHRMDL